MIKRILRALGLIKICRCAEIQDNMENYVPRPGEIINITCERHGSYLERYYHLYPDNAPFSFMQLDQGEIEKWWKGVMPNETGQGSGVFIDSTGERDPVFFNQP